MSNENYELNNENYEAEGTNDTAGSGSNKGLLALAAGGVLLVGGLAAAGIKKLKGKKDEDKPKKQKTKYKIVKVPVADDEEIVEEEIETVEEDVEEPKKGKKK